MQTGAEVDYREKAYVIGGRLQGCALKIVTQAEIKITERGMIDPKVLALILLCRTLSNFQGVIVMTQQRRIVEARTLARCCYENLFLIEGLRAKGMEFAERMLEDDHAGRKGRLRFALETEAIFKKLSDELQEAVEDRHTTLKTAPKVKFLRPSDASELGEFKEMYLVYSQMSGDAAHPALMALSRHWDGKSDGGPYLDAQPEAKDDELDETLHLTSTAVLSAMVVTNEIVGLTDAGNELLALNHELKLLQAERWGADSIEEGMEILTEKPKES